jgi:hypothetical protein
MRVCTESCHVNFILVLILPNSRNVYGKIVYFSVL